MKVAVHNHFNARKLCDIEIADDVANRLAKPPRLKDNFITLPDGSVVNRPKPEDHVVEVAIGTATLRLFKAKVNGVDFVMTNTPAVALSAAA